MTEGSFVSSVPGIYEALERLVREAAAEQSKPVSVFPDLLAQFEPERYIIFGPVRGPRYDWHAHPIQLEETYEICGKVTIFSGESAATNTSLASEVLTECFALLGECVMAPALLNRDAPTFGTSGPSAQVMFPVQAEYQAGLDIIGGQPGGWGGVIDWALTFKAIISPAPYSAENRA
jgi:hypothetical protein